MTKEQVKEFQQLIGTAAWKLDLWKFADIVGHNVDHDYTKEKFRQLNGLSKAVSAFDSETLTEILNAV